MLTGLRPETFQNLQLNAGVFLLNFDYSAINDKAALEVAVLAALESGEGVLGATIGGGNFNCTPSMRTIEADGMRYPFVGSTVNDMWTVELSTTLKEVTPENFALALVSADVTNNSGKTIVSVRTDIKNTDYQNKLCWVGDLSDGKFVLIELDNALNTAGANFVFSDKSEGTIPVTFRGHVSGLKSQVNAPCRVIFFDDAV